MTAKMTSAERFAAFLSRREHDRIPRFDGYWPETIERWQHEGLDGSAETVLGLLRSDIGGVCWTWPVPFPDQHEVLEEDEQTQLVRTNMGKIERHWKSKSGTPEHIEFGCDSAAKWFEQFKPALLTAGLSVTPTDAVEAHGKLRKAGKFSAMQGIESFEAMRQLCGDEILLMAMAAEPEWVRDMSTTYTDLILKDLAAAYDAGCQADAVWVFGDVGYNHGSFFSPAAYGDLIRPDHIRLCDWAHQRGMKFIYHTDGDVRLLLDLFVEAGFDCIQPMEAKAHMDVRDLAPKYGQRLSFFGNVDMMVAATGDRDRIEHEMRTKLAAGMANWGYAYHSDHSVPPTVSWPTYQFIIELLDQYGGYD